MQSDAMEIVRLGRSRKKEEAPVRACVRTCVHCGLEAALLRWGERLSGTGQKGAKETAAGGGESETNNPSRLWGITSEALVYRISRAAGESGEKWATRRGVEKQMGNESRGKGTENKV